MILMIFNTFWIHCILACSRGRSQICSTTAIHPLGLTSRILYWPSLKWRKTNFWRIKIKPGFLYSVHCVKKVTFFFMFVFRKRLQYPIRRFLFFIIHFKQKVFCFEIPKLRQVAINSVKIIFVSEEISLFDFQGKHLVTYYWQF